MPNYGYYLHYGYTDMNTADFKRMFAALQRESGGVIKIEDAPRILNNSSLAVRKLLSRWEKQGWITRLKRGLYLPVPLEAESAEKWTEDPWILATILFEPCYIGGWSACEYWQFTEQIFREVIVFTHQSIRNRKQTILANSFNLKKIIPKRFFGTKTVWKGQMKLKVSDPARTIVDLFDDPSVGGGFRQAAGVLDAYVNSTNKNLPQLLEYMQRFGNKALFNRIGYLFERKYPNEREFIKTCQKGIAKGYSKLDPTGPSSGSYLRRWNLRINRDLPL